MEWDNKKVIAISISAFAIALAIVAASWFLSKIMLRVQKTEDETITVKGVATEEVVSDLGSVSCTIRCKAQDKGNGYAQLKRDEARLMDKFKQIGIADGELAERSVRCDTVNKTHTIKEGQKTTTKDEFSHYMLSERFEIRSADVAKIAKTAPELFSLIGEGLDISVDQPSFFIENPERYKQRLIDAASGSAYCRAKIVADTCGGKLGNLKRARQGVIQINKLASNESSDYGVYDTSSIRKVIRMVVTLEFALK